LCAKTNDIVMRRGRDSNPRYPVMGYTPLAGERFRPLSHLSKRDANISGFYLRVNIILSLPIFVNFLHLVYRFEPDYGLSGHNQAHSLIQKVKGCESLHNSAAPL